VARRLVNGLGSAGRLAGSVPMSTVVKASREPPNDAKDFGRRRPECGCPPGLQFEASVDRGLSDLGDVKIVTSGVTPQSGERLSHVDTSTLEEHTFRLLD
jgi:hypothetical protein